MQLAWACANNWAWAISAPSIGWPLIIQRLMIGLGSEASKHRKWKWAPFWPFEPGDYHYVEATTNSRSPGTTRFSCAPGPGRHNVLEHYIYGEIIRTPLSEVQNCVVDPLVVYTGAVLQPISPTAGRPFFQRQVENRGSVRDRVAHQRPSGRSMRPPQPVQLIAFSPFPPRNCLKL